MALKSIWISLRIIILLVFLLQFNSSPKVTLKEKVSIKKDTVLLVSLELEEKQIVPVIADRITSFYHFPVKVIEDTLPKYAYYAPRKRYRAEKLINYLSSINNKNYRFVVGLTSVDISTTAYNVYDFGIFGLGTLDNTGCISSTHRLKDINHEKFLERIEKVILHEIGHNCGLNHCVSPYPCFMKAAKKKLSQVDSEPIDICVECKRKIPFK